MDFTGSVKEQNGLTSLFFELPGDIAVSKNLIAHANGLSSNFLPIDYVEKVGGCRISYEVGSRISLSKFLLFNNVGEEWVLAILKGISDALSLCKENAMYCENLSLNPDYIYLNPKELNVKLVYFPFETGRQTVDC